LIKTIYNTKENYLKVSISYFGEWFYLKSLS
jgi:hypothetical protein